MAAQIQRLPRIRREPGPAPITADQAYWKSFKNQLLLPSPHNSAITSITTPDYNPTGSQADTFAVTSGGRVQIYNSKTRKLVKTISRFGVDDTARSGTLRRDGRILLAGGDSGVVQAFDTGSRAILRQWRGEHGHKLPVHAVRWSPSILTDLMSCSDDRTVRLWDLTEDVAKWTGVAHEDYVRCGCFLPDQQGLLVSGSYDQTVRLWDTRQERPALTFKHASPIESLVAFNSTTIAAASGSEVSILNLAAGKPEHIIRSHQKTVTSLSTTHRAGRLVTGALDGHVKVHNTTSWEVVTGLKYPSPVLSLAVVKTMSQPEEDDRHLAVGMENGLLSLRTRLAGTEKVKTREKEKRMQALIAGKADEYERKQKKKDMRQGIRARDRGKEFRGEGADIVITGDVRSPEDKKKKPQWERSLKEGKYGLALDQVLRPNKGLAAVDNEDILSLLVSLRHRSAMRTALANRQEQQLVPVLQWCLKHLSHPKDITLTYDVVLLVLDIYSHMLPEWEADDEGAPDRPKVGKLIKGVEKKVKHEINLSHQAHMMLGMIETIQAG